MRVAFFRNALRFQKYIPGPGSSPMPVIPPKPGTSANLGTALESEMKRRRQLEEETRARYVVVKEETNRQKGRAIGVDLGTTNSCISYIDRKTKQPKIIPSPTGSWVFPTAVTFDRNHQTRVYGEEARACARTSTSATLCSGKRLIGRSFGELGRVQSQLHKTNMLTVNEKGEVAVEISGRTYTIVHIIAMFLRYLKREAERYLKEPVDLLVVSVPAYFSPQQKVATEDAALAAGFDVLEVIDEPTAACLTHTVLTQGTESEDKSKKRKKLSVVFDLGGGTLDCAIMEYDHYWNTFKLISTHGDPLLGGNDWDSVISQHFAEQFEAKWRVPIEEEDGNVGQGASAYRLLQLEAERAKIHFTHSTKPYYGYNRGFHYSKRLRDIVPLEATLTYEEYLELTRPLRVKCIECLDKLFQLNRYKPSDIDTVLLVGAMTRDPPVRGMLEDYFSGSVSHENTCPADYAVALGAAIRAGMLQGEFPELTSRTQFVSGSEQSLKEKGIMRRLWSQFKSIGRNANANAIGRRWRGKAKGLSDTEIANYAKELVEFEAAFDRRQLLERAENDANYVMRRVAADSNKRQGMQEKRIQQLSDQLKFWQYMVHNFHDHEEELNRTVRELEKILDELEGYTEDNTEALTPFGTIDFSAAELQQKEQAEASSAAATEEPVVGDHSGKMERTTPAYKGSPDHSERDEKTPIHTPKILRRSVPLPKGSSEVGELFEAGHPAFRGADVHMTESVRNSLFEAQVEERAWREPPVPPGEEGSWEEVKKIIESGDLVGEPIPAHEVGTVTSAEDMLQWLKINSPIDDPPTPEHARLREMAVDIFTMRIDENNVDMDKIESSLYEDLKEKEKKIRDDAKAARALGEKTSAFMFRG